MKAALLLATLLLATAIAGCSSGPGEPTQTVTSSSAPDLSRLSKALYAIRAPQEVWVPAASDGKLLYNAVYLPEVGNGTRVPVFINFSPYWGDSAMAEGDAFANYMIHEYVPRGYAVVLSAVRGTGHSQGCFQIAGDMELQDAYDVVDFFATQEWSNGNVGAGGKSYDSTTQNGLVAKFPHPALKTLFHVSGITDMYRYNAKAGVVYQNGLDFTARYFFNQGTDEYGLPTGTGGGSNEDEDAESLVRLLDDAACPEAAKHVQSGEGTAADGVKDAYWQERDWNAFMPQSSWNGSVFFVHGLQDWNVKPDHIDPWVDILQSKGLEVKGWLHQETENLGHLYPMRQDWNLTMLRWLDWYLKGIDTGIQHELGFDVQGSDETWRHEEAWPPVGTGNLTLDVATPGANLDADAPEVGHRFAGTPYATVRITSASPDPVLRLALYDVGPDGEQVWINEAVLRLAIADDLSGPRPWTPGSSGAFTLEFYPMDHEMEAGHHFAVEVGLDPTKQETPTPADFAYTPVQAVGTTYESIQLHLPIVDGSPVLDPQPLRMKCFTC